VNEGYGDISPTTPSFDEVVGDHHNRKGLISDRGQRKLAFYTLQKFYGKLADAEK
jgi:hypothetical protein